MFYDMAILVDEQGEMIDRIEHNVEMAAAHVETGQQNIRRAAEYSSSNRKVSLSLFLNTVELRLMIAQMPC